MQPSAMAWRPEWTQITNCFSWSLPDALAGSVIAERKAEVLAHVHALPTNAEHYGMIHFDMLVVYPRQERPAFAAHFLREFIRGYAIERPLDAFWVSQLPYFLKLLEINIYAQVSPHHDPADTTSWVGKFLAEDRRQRIESGVPYVETDFAGAMESLEA
ncbi:MAG: hypothetical protein ACP5HS_12640 [Anaerolineae bacterium]